MANTQDEPAMDRHTASDDSRLDGIVDQTRADVGGKDAEAVEHVLRQRLEQVGIDVPASKITDIAQKLASGG